MSHPTAPCTRDGFIVIDGLLEAVAVQRLELSLERLPVAGARSRGLLASSWCRDLARELRSNTRLAGLLPRAYVAVPCLLFRKSMDSNWLVRLHREGET